MTTTTPAFLALRLGKRWVPTGFRNLADIDQDMISALEGTATMYSNAPGMKNEIVLCSNSNPKKGDEYLQSHHFAPVRSFQCKLERPYESTASCAGSSPGVSGRVDWSDFLVERSCDAASPVIFENCCTGEGFERAMLCYWVNDSIEPEPGRKLVRIEFCSPNISSYEIIGDRWFGETVTPTSPTRELATARELKKKPGAFGATRKERVTFWHTQMSVTFHGVGKGWNAGTETPYQPPWLPWP